MKRDYKTILRSEVLALHAEGLNDTAIGRRLGNGLGPIGPTTIRKFRVGDEPNYSKESYRAPISAMQGKLQSVTVGADGAIDITPIAQPLRLHRPVRIVS